MLVDINANIGHWPFIKTNCNSCRELASRMDKYGTNVSVISNMNGIFYKDTNASNEELIAEINSDRAFRNRFIPFGIINPIYAGWKDDLEYCHKQGMKGVRLYPLYHDYEITDPACIELVRMAKDMGMVVAFTLRMVDSRIRSWMDLSKEWTVNDVLPVIREVPDARYFILNVTGGIMLNDADTLLIRNSSILFDTSGKNIGDLPGLIKKYGREKFAFGSHSPILDYATGLLRIESLREEEADRETMELLRSGNALKYL